MKNLNYFILFFVIVLIALVFFLLFEVRTEGSKCVVNPLVYGIKQVEKSNNAQFLCTCSLIGKPSPSIYLNSSGLFVDYGKGSILG